MSNSGKPPLFFDLDGPLLDVKRRYHAVYAGIASELGVTPLPLDDYWTAKRQRAPLGLFFPGLEAGPTLRLEYLERWLPRIEASEWLVLDTLVKGAADCLRMLAETYRLYLVTLRREPAALHRQLDALDLRHNFHDVFSGWAEDGAAADLKASWMRPLVVGEQSALVGDSEVDMAAARQLGIRVLGVSFGIREAGELIALGAERVVDHLSELPEVLGMESIAPDAWNHGCRTTEAAFAEPGS
jgi:phosphoglycolate phosphatase-like HAD superfamily hydrolase